MKRLMLVLCFILLVFGSAFGGEYSDVVDVQKDLMDLSADYNADMEKADSAKSVAAAMNAYAKGLESLAPRIKEINEKYPELRDPEQMPEEVKQAAEEQPEVMQKVSSSFMKAMPYINEAAVQEAQQRIMAAMQGMGPQER
ncbi:MAG: hypothetical protein KFF46_04445 [Desulfobacterales bacterium]|nr:hypothetical protein [Desulfobacterales bacterium]